MYKLLNVVFSYSGYSSEITGHSNRVYCVKYNPVEVNQIFSGGWDDTVQIWDDRMQNSIK